jgi:hypothetical protein
VRALNFNGAGPFSSPSTFYTCLPPEQIKPVQFVSSTASQMTVTWSQPLKLNGCQLTHYSLLMDSAEVAQFDPHITQHTVSGFAAADKGKSFVFEIKAVTHGGSVTSGTNSFVLASTPQKPA